MNQQIKKYEVTEIKKDNTEDEYDEPPSKKFKSYMKRPKLHQNNCEISYNDFSGTEEDESQEDDDKNSKKTTLYKLGKSLFKV